MIGDQSAVRLANQAFTVTGRSRNAGRCEVSPASSSDGRDFGALGWADFGAAGWADLGAAGWADLGAAGWADLGAAGWTGVGAAWSCGRPFCRDERLPRERG